MQNIPEIYFEKNKEINITIKTIDSQVFKVNINPEKTILELKESISKSIKFPIKNQRLIYQGKVLKNNEKIKDYKIYNEYVIHLVHQSDNPNQGSNIENTGINQHSQSNNSIRETRMNNMENELNNYQNYFQNILNSFNMINTSNSEIGTLRSNTNRFEQEIIVPESYLNLSKSNFIKVDSIETIKQNINNLKELFNLTEKINDFTVKRDNLCTFREIKSSKLKIGQWVDVKDSLNQWTEGQIINMRNNMVQIHYNGWSSNRHEWIELNTSRISLFRTYTVQSPFNKFLSPSPNIKPETNLILSDTGKFEDFDNLNELIDFLDNLRNKLQQCIIDKESLAANKVKVENDKNPLLEEEITKKEKNLFLLFSQVAPLMDRVGRLLADFSLFLQNYCFEFFSNNCNLFNHQISNNVNNIREYKVHKFHKISTVPCMRNPGEIAETNNLNRPRIGIIVAQNTPLINNMPNTVQTNSRSINNSPSNSIKRFENLQIEAKNNIMFNSPKKVTKDFSSQLSSNSFIEKCRTIELSLISIIKKTSNTNNNQILTNSGKISLENNLSKTSKKNEKIIVDIVDKRIINPRDNFMNKNSINHFDIKKDNSNKNGKITVKIKKGQEILRNSINNI